MSRGVGCSRSRNCGGVGRTARVPEALAFIKREQLFGVGCGLIDILLRASTPMIPGAARWTLEKRLGLLAERSGVGDRAVKR